MQSENNNHFQGFYRFYEFNSFEGSGKTETLELVFADNLYTGYLRQSDRYDVTDNFPRNYAIRGKYNPDTTILELEYTSGSKLAKFLFKKENDCYMGNYPESDDQWIEWEKIN